MDRMIEDLLHQWTDADDVSERQRALDAYEPELTLELRLKTEEEGKEAFHSGHYQKAQSLFELSLAIASRLEDRIGMGTSLHNLGTTLIVRGDRRAAKEAYSRSLSYKDPERDQQDIARTYNNLGAISKDEGDYAEAFAYYEKSLEIKRSFNDMAGIARSLHNIAEVHELQGDYRQVLREYDRSLELKRMTGDRTLPNTLLNLGALHHFQGHSELASYYYEQALGYYRAAEDQASVADALNNLGETQYDQHHFDQAIPLFQESLRLANEAGYPEAAFRASVNLGALERERGDLPAALAALRASLRVHRRASRPSDLAGAYMIIGEIRLDQGEHQHAVRWTRRAIHLAKRLRIPFIQWPAWELLGRIRLSQGLMDEARSAFEESVRIIESVRLQVAGEEMDRMRYMEDKIAPYHRLIELLMDQGDIKAAFAYAQRAKGRSLLDALHGSALPRPLSEREHELLRELAQRRNELEDALMREPDNLAVINDLNDRLNEKRLEYEAYKVAAVRDEDPNALHSALLSLASMEHAAVLDPDLALLEYVVTPKRVFGFLVTNASEVDAKDSVPWGENGRLSTHVASVSTESLRRSVSAFRKALTERRPGFASYGRSLYQSLISPFRDRLPKSEGSVPRLCLIPDGFLWDLPFQALQSPDGRYLLEEICPFYIPSAAVLQSLRSHRNPPPDEPDTLLAVGNPDFGAREADGGDSASPDGPALMGDKLAPLPETEAQVRQLALLYGSDNSRILIGKAARESEIKKDAGQYRVLHIATHGLMDPLHPMQSALALAAPSPEPDSRRSARDDSMAEDDMKEDGFLEAWEVARLRIKADLVALSACETARGKIGPGEGIVGMTWAFLLAGAASTIVSQWKVRSDSATDLMLEFHRHYRSGRLAPDERLTKAEALRQAALRSLDSEEYRHPFFWAAFILVGEGG